MTATVDILVQATDNATQVLNDLQGEFADLQKTQDRLNAAAKQNGLASKEQAAKFKELRGSVDEVVQGLTGFSLKQLSVAGVVVMAGNAAVKATTDYMDYALAMDKLSMTMGTTVEDTSRLVQVADDFRVEQGVVENAMRMAVQNGFTPTIENIAILADRYNSISDPVQRAAAMQDIFGKQWAEMQPLLEAGGDTIRESAAAMDEAMVITAAEVEQARAAAKAIDDWNDSWTALKNNFATSVLPVFTDTLNQVNKNNAAINEAGIGWMRFIPGLQGVVSLIGYQNSLEAENTTETKKATQAITAQTNATQAIVQQDRRYLAGITGLGNGIDDITAKNIRYQATLKRVEAAAQNLQKAHEDVTAAQKRLNEAQDAFNENYGSKAASALAKYAGEGKKYREGLEIQDKVLGTNTAAQYDAQKSLEELSRKFASGQITNAEYQAGLEKQKPAWEALDANIQKAKLSLQEAYAEWNKFYGALSTANGSEFHVRVTVDYSGMGGGGGNPQNTGAGGREGQSGRHGGEAYASGGQFVIPPGYNETWPVGPNKTASSGETVTITPPGKSAPSGGGITIQNVNLPGVTNASQFIAELGRLAKNAKNSGAATAGAW